MTYFPRSSFATLYDQYLGYGRGRARNTLKHRIIPRLRQTVPLSVLPAVVLSLFTFLHWAAAVPLAVWLAVCLGFGGWTAIRNGKPQLILAGLSAMVIHFAWSLGFWLQLLASAGKFATGAQADREVAR
jgi:succinoglycan biosynthesis protein ExoA